MKVRPRTYLRDDQPPEYAVGRYAPRCTQAPHTHDYDGITLVLRGCLQETVGARVEAASALSVVFKPAGVVHALAVGEEGVTTLQVRLAAGTLAAALPDRVPTDRVSVLPAGWLWSHAGPAAAGMLRSLTTPCRSPGRWGVPGAAGRRVAASSLLRVVSDAYRGLRFESEPQVLSAPVWLQQVRESLAAQARGVRLAEAARAARVHPVYLARMFRRHYGCSVGDVAKRARLRLAARLLGEPDLPLTDVAGEAGFADQAHLCREFRFGTGVTPLQFRRVAVDA